MHVSVKFENEEDRPEYISIYLSTDSDKEEKISTPKAMVYHERLRNFPIFWINKLGSYYAAIDLGQPNTIFPINNSYTLKLFVGDRNLSINIEDTLAILDIKFAHKRDPKELSDQYVEQKE